MQEAVGCAYEQWDGNGWPGGRAGDGCAGGGAPVRLADYVEVAYRMGGVDAARDVARSRQRQAVRPRTVGGDLATKGEMILSGLDDVGTWDAVIDAEPALAVAVGADQLDEALRAVANFVDLKSPYRPRARRGGGRPGRRRRPRGWGCRKPT